MKHSISVFFPCYNEEKNVEKIVTLAISVLREVSEDFEVIIVNDGSKDKTGEIAETLARSNREVKAIHHLQNKGYGAALKSGFANATEDLVFYTDGDNQFDIREIKGLLALIDRVDIVSGYRLDRKDPFYRKVNAILYNLALRILFGLKIKDVDCAFKLYKRKIFDRFEVKSDSALIDAEILIKAIRQGYTIGQIGIHHYPRIAGKQTGAKLSVILRTFVELTNLWKELKERR